MNNIPVYLSQGGTATLILREIPHKKTAYILLRTIPKGKLELMISDCAAFCRSCGAEHCFISAERGPAVLPLPHAYDILHMQVEKAALPAPESDISLTPITAQNDSIYLHIYNRCFQDVSHALTYDRAQISRIYQQKHRAFLALSPENTPWGMGELHGNELAAVGVLPEFRGRGRNLTLALLRHCPGPMVTLTVVSDNARAIRLYEQLGFTVTGTESVWYTC